MEKYYFFWGGPFSNWAPSVIEIEDRVFVCAEQYMMYKKAMYFGDTEIAKQIMDVDDPATQKQLGRQVSNFDPVKWREVCEEQFYPGLLAKYQQNEYLKTLLCDTEDKKLVEASPHDRIWGIGYNAVNALSNMDSWGENLLGKMLERVREELCR